MIALSLLLLAAAFAAGGLAWLVREVTKADRQRIAEAWERLADVQRRIDEAREVLADMAASLGVDWLAPVPQQPTFEQCYDRVEVEDMHEWFAMPSPLDVWQEGDEIHRRGDR